MENYRCVTSVQEIQQYVSNAAVVAFDYETAPDEPYRIEEKAAFPPKSIRESMFLLLIKLEETWMALLFSISAKLSHKQKYRQSCSQYCL